MGLRPDRVIRNDGNAENSVRRQVRERPAHSVLGIRAGL
jgi:hypothetical protein